MASRAGLREVASNSPALGSLTLLSAKSGSVSPSKLILKKPISPLVSISEDNKENGTQTIIPETSTSATQTVVGVTGPAPELSDKDLCSEKPTAAYWQCFAEELDKDIDDEIDTSLSLSHDLDVSLAKLKESEEALSVLKEVVADIEREKEDEAYNSEE